MKFIKGCLISIDVKAEIVQRGTKIYGYDLREKRGFWSESKSLTGSVSNLARFVSRNTYGRFFLCMELDLIYKS